MKNIKLKELLNEVSAKDTGDLFKQMNIALVNGFHKWKDNWQDGRPVWKKGTPSVAKMIDKTSFDTPQEKAIRESIIKKEKELAKVVGEYETLLKKYKKAL